MPAPTADYLPLDLAPLCNAGPEVLGPGAAPPTGRVALRGLPFQIGPAAGAGPCFVARGGRFGSDPLAIPVGQVARRVVVAHRLLESRLFQGGPVGAVVAHYLFTLADGEVVRVPIRERLEIALVLPPGPARPFQLTPEPRGWGQHPLLAWPDTFDALEPREAGAWFLAGRRQTEVVQAWPRAYYLWVWANPRPEQAIRSITIEPAGPAFLVAGVTLGLLDEDPINRAAKRALRITLPRPEDAARPFALSVEVDRGVATYPYPLPRADAEQFLADPMAGWGEEENAQASPAYVEIAATPSATITVRQEGEPLGAARWGELQERGRLLVNDRLSLEVIDRGENWVRTTVVDDATDQPIPCRIHFRSPEGVPYAPHGHHPHVNSDQGSWHIDVGGDVRLGQISYAYIDGTCEGWLPRGEVLVDVARGFQYEPLRTRVTIAPGQQELRLRLRRWTDMAARRWFSGDTHVHFLSTQGSHLEARGEDLNVVNLLLSQWGHLFTNTEEFTGEPSISRDGRTIVYATQENRQHMLGHLTLLGLKRPVMPWCSDGPSEAELGGHLETTLSHWADACHAQGGTVIIPHLPTPNGEPAALIATGRADAVEMIRAGRYEHLEYYRYLNGGYRLPLVGGTDKMSNEVPVGLYRTYVHIPPDQPFTYETWCAGLRAGRTFLSGGPLLSFSVDGHLVGDTVSLPGNGGTVEVEATAESPLPIHALEIVQQGEVVARVEERTGARRLHLKTALPIPRHTWLAARVAGPDGTFLPHHDVWRRGILAHSSPIYVAVGGPWWLYDPGTASYMLTLCEASIAYIRQVSVQPRPGSRTHHHGEADHRAFLERPFHEAIAALHRRAHELGMAH